MATSVPPTPATAAPPAASAPPPWMPLAAVGVTLVLWASAFVAIRHLGEDFSAGALSLGRLGVGAVALALLAVPRGVARPTGPQWRSIISIGVLWYAIYMVALNEGEQRIDAGTASLLIQVSPVLIAVLAAVLLDEPFTRGLGLGLALAFAGVAIIALADAPGGSHDALGVGLCLVSAVAYAIALVIQKPLAGVIPALQVTWLACTAGAVVCLPFLPQLIDELADAPTSSIVWLAYLGVFPTAIAFTTYGYALQHMSVSSLGVTTYLVPPLTILMSLVLLGEVPPAIAYAGGALALLGVAVARRAARRS